MPIIILRIKQIRKPHSITRNSMDTIDSILTSLSFIEITIVRIATIRDVREIDWSKLCLESANIRPSAFNFFNLSKVQFTRDYTG